MASLRDRLARLEATRGLAPRGGVVVYGVDETPLQAIARSGRTGACIAMPAPPASQAAWERKTRADQITLLQRSAIVAATGKDPDR